MTQSLLLNETLKLLRDRPRHLTYLIIANSTGISVRWLTSLICGDIKDPGINRIAVLHDYLSRNIPQK